MATAAQNDVLLSLVIPVYDEVDNLEPLVLEIEEVRASFPCRSEVILVDDASTDGSWDAIRGMTATRHWLRGLRFLGNQGQTAALAAGIEVARGSLIAFMDADMQNDPRDIPKMLQPILEGRADAVCGWRVHRKDDALSRTLPS